MKFVATVIFLLSIAPLSGCAIGTRYVNLNYPLQPGSVQDTPEAAERPTIPSPGKTIVLQVNDVRHDRTSVGAIRNMTGSITASVLAKDEVSDWVRNAVMDELRHRGHRVVGSTERGAEDPPITMVVDIRKVNCDVHTYYDAEVTLGGSLWLEHEPLASDKFPVKVNTGLSWLMSANGIEVSLSEALQQSIRAMLQGLGLD